MTALEVKEVRSRAGLTQSEFAQRLHVSQVTVSRWENGKSCPLPIFESEMSLMLAEAHGLAMGQGGGGNGQKEG